MLNRSKDIVYAAAVEDHRREEVVRHADDPRVARRRAGNTRKRKDKVHYAVGDVQAADDFVLATEDLAALAERDVNPGRADLERIRIGIRNSVRRADRRREGRGCLAVHERPHLLGAGNRIVVDRTTDEEADRRRRNPVVAVTARNIRRTHAPDIHGLELAAAETRKIQLRVNRRRTADGDVRAERRLLEVAERVRERLRYHVLTARQEVARVRHVRLAEVAVRALEGRRVRGRAYDVRVDIEDLVHRIQLNLNRKGLRKEVSRPGERLLLRRDAVPREFEVAVGRKFGLACKVTSRHARLAAEVGKLVLLDAVLGVREHREEELVARKGVLRTRRWTYLDFPN